MSKGSIFSKKTDEKEKIEKFEVKIQQEDQEKIQQIVKIAIGMKPANGIFALRFSEQYILKFNGLKECNMTVPDNMIKIIEEDIKRIRQEASKKSVQQ